MLSLFLAETAEINTEGGMRKCFFLYACCEQTKAELCVDDRLCNCQFDLADSIISCNKHREDLQEGKDILAEESSVVGGSRRSVTFNTFAHADACRYIL